MYGLNEAFRSDRKNFSNQRLNSKFKSFLNFIVKSKQNFKFSIKMADYYDEESDRLQLVAVSSSSSEAALSEILSDELIKRVSNDDWDAYYEMTRRRPQHQIQSRLLGSNEPRDLTNHLETSLLMWPIPPNVGVKHNHSLYTSTYKGRWLFTQHVFVKATTRYDRNTKQSILHELEMSDRFQTVSPKCMAFSPYTAEGGIKIAFEYMPLNLKQLMNEGIDKNFTVPSELARILAEISGQNHLIREFRITKFVGRESK